MISETAEVDPEVAAPPRELLPDDAESVPVVEPLGSTVDCGECGKRVPEGECCPECHHGCSMPGNDCPGRPL